MISQITDFADPSFRSVCLAHAECVSVVKPERLGHQDPFLEHGPAHVFFASDRLAITNSIGQELFTDRPGVVDISVDISRLQGFPENLRPPQLRLVLALGARRTGEMGQAFPEEH